MGKARRSFRGVPFGKDDGALAGLAKFHDLRGGADRDGEGMRMLGAVVQFAQFLNAVCKTRFDGEGPERTGAAHGKFLVHGELAEFLNIGVGSTGKKEEFVEVTLRQGLGFLARKPAIVH